MIRKLLVGMAGAVAADYLAHGATLKPQIDKMIPTDSKNASAYYAALSGAGAALAIKYFGG